MGTGEDAYPSFLAILPAPCARIITLKVWQLRPSSILASALLYGVPPVKSYQLPYVQVETGFPNCAVDLSEDSATPRQLLVQQASGCSRPFSLVCSRLVRLTAWSVAAS